MNKRIEELEKQAYTEVMHERGGTYMAFDKEKFAELIAGECADIAREYDAPKLSGPGLNIASRIEEHFGVEE